MRVEINIGKGPRAIVNTLLAARKIFGLESPDWYPEPTPPPHPGNTGWGWLADESDREAKEWERHAKESETEGEEDG